MSKQTEIIISLGSNFNAKENIDFAKKKLKAMLGEETVFTQEIWTDPIGIVSDRFINCICFSKTKHALTQLLKAFKQLEKQRSRSKKNDRLNKITLDIDILKYGDTKYHEEDWNRDYVKELIAESNKDSFIIDPTIK